MPFIKSIDIISFGFSDHRGVLMHADFRTFTRGPSNFKLNVEILKDIEFVNMVKQEIKKISVLSNYLNPDMFWECIKAQIRSLAIIYSRSKAKFNSFKIYDLEGKLSNLESQFVNDPGNNDLELQILKTKNELEIFSIAETRGAQIRAGIKFSELGEKCNKFFLGLEKCRSTNNTIFKIHDSNKFLTEPDTILDFISNYYETLYKSPPSKLDYSDDVHRQFLNRDNINVIDETERDFFNIQISEGELLSTLKSTKNGSAPGLDGLPMEVYKIFWHDLKIPLLNCFHECFKNGTLTPSQSQGLLCLLHKGGNNPRENISSWRPIALLNADYKLIAKLLCLRLKTVINKLIDSQQFAFIKGRNISHMLRELYDIIENEKNSNSNTILLSIDYSKAFDTLSTGAIIEALKLYGFDDYYLNCIKTILSNRTCCIRNGGFISEEFHMERGVRQGCPISPLLFILTSELFAASVRNDPTIKGIKLYKSNRYVKILQYADDITLLLKDIIDFREILSKIKLFSEFSGLHINIKKSHAMTLGGDSWAGRFICGIEFVEKLKILGIVFSATEDARFIPENIEGKIDSLKRVCSLWSRRILTLQGKILILKVYGLSLFINVIQSIGISDNNISRINTIFFRIIWSKKPSDIKVIERVKRSVLCSPKCNGGLNMINLRCFQDSFLLRWAEKLLDDQKADWKIAAIKCLEKVGGLSAFKSTLPRISFKCFNLIHNSFWKEVLGVWLDNRHPMDEKPSFSPESPLFNNPLIKYRNSVLFFPQLISRGVLYVKDLLLNNHLIDFDSFKRIVNIPGSFLIYTCLFNALYPLLNTVFVNDISSLENAIAKQLKFKYAYLGSIGRKGFYNLLVPKETPISEMYWSRKLGYEFPKIMWSLPFIATIESRLQVLQWKILINIYPTAILLSKMKIKSSGRCDTCNSLETVEHFFYFCLKRKKLWDYVSNIIVMKFSKRFAITWEKAILGVIAESGFNKAEIRTINNIFLIAKMSISKSEYGTKQDSCIVMEQELRRRKLLPSI